MQLLPLIFLVLSKAVICMEELEDIVPIGPQDVDITLENSHSTPYFLCFFKTQTREDLASFDKYFKPFKQAYINAKSENYSLKFGIIDAANHYEVATRLGVSEFPQYKFLITGSVLDYIGNISSEDIIDYIKIKLDPPSKEFYVPEDLEKFIENREVLVFFGLPQKNNPKFLQFLDVARRFSDVLFAHCGMIECIEYYRIGWNELIFFKKHHNRSIELRDPYTDYMITKLVEDNYTKTMDHFDEWVADFVFVRNNVGLFLFRDKDNPEHAKYELLAKRVSRYFKSFIYFIIVDIKNKFELELAKITKIKYNDLPCVYLYDARREQIFKYKLEAEITEANLYQFAIDFGTNKLNEYHSSEEIPEETSQGQIVRTLVGKSYNKEVQEDFKNYIFIFFYGDECQHCHKAGLLFERTAKYISEKNQNIKFYKINYDWNEIPFMDIVGYPNMKLFPPRSRSTPNDYPIDKDRSMKKIAEFLRENIPELDISNFDDKLDEDFEVEYENLFMDNSSNNSTDQIKDDF
jgi:hypothetical protein